MIPHADPRAEISETARRFLRSFAQHDIAAIAACYTEDAQMLPAHMKPIDGRAAIGAVFKFTGGQGHTLEFLTRELDVLGASAVEIGEYVRRAGDGSTVDQGKYIVIWKRVDGEWKIHRDMFNTSRPRAGS